MSPRLRLKRLPPTQNPGVPPSTSKRDSWMRWMCSAPTTPPGSMHVSNWTVSPWVSAACLRNRMRSRLTGLAIQGPSTVARTGASSGSCARDPLPALPTGPDPPIGSEGLMMDDLTAPIDPRKPASRSAWWFSGQREPQLVTAAGRMVISGPLESAGKRGQVIERESADRLGQRRGRVEVSEDGFELHLPGPARGQTQPGPTSGADHPARQDRKAMAPGLGLPADFA